jgi:hypothetical protein
MATSPLIAVSGLSPQVNPLTQDAGLDLASNIIIRRDNVVESRRGFKLFGNAMGNSSDISKQLLQYKDLILRHYNSTLQYQVTEGSETFNSFAGTYSEPETGIRIRGIESNGNFYFTTSDGIKKISAKTVSGLSTSSGFITNAGGVKALDNKAYLNIVLGSSSGFLPADSAVAYRVVWGIKDANGNLVLGTPSERAEVYNPLSSLIAQDLNNLLLQLDNVGYSNTGSLSGTTYLDTYGASYAADGSTLKTQVVALAAALDNDILLNSGNATMNAQVFAGGLTAVVQVNNTVATTIAAGDHITLSGFTTGGLTQLNGQHFTVTSITADGPNFDLNLALYPSDATPLTVQAQVNDTGGVINSYNYGYIVNTGSTDFPTSLVDTVIDTPATHDQLATIHDTIERIMARLQAELTGVIDATAKAAFIDQLAITVTATVFLEFTIPDDVTTSHFYQIYRSAIAEATGVSSLIDITPSDELQLVYEGFPTAQELIDQKVIVEDVTPDQFRGANLYTNASTGEGILQSNDVPPFATDINRFKNYTFYANTRTRHRFSISMLGVQQLINDANAGITPTLTVSTSGNSETFKFVLGVQEETDIQVAPASAITAGEYFTLNSANDTREYYFWFRKSGSGTDPAVAGKTGVVIDILNADADTVVATKVANAIAAINADFEASAAADIVTVVNVDEGPCTDATEGDTPFVVMVITEGQGEDSATNSVLLSQLASVARAVDATARSLVRIINRSSASIYAYYLSGATDVPGKMLFESRVLGDTANPFYVFTNNSNVGTSFNPILSPDLSVDAGVSILYDDPASGQVTLNVTGHGLLTGEQIIISGSSNATPTIDIDGIHTITKIDANSFWITATLVADSTVVANSIGISYLPDVQVSNNEVKPNRVYYSKLQQPEAVPLVNFFDVGAEDKAVLRIVPLRDTLFVFKEDGLYRISGESAPFTLSLFDESCVLVAPDSIGILNNVVFGWTRKGIDNITESGVQNISRPIDTLILPIASSKYANFRTATWGVGYESDNSYLVATVVNVADTVANIIYRFSNLTGTWTTFDKTNTCGIVGPDDRLYMGAGDTNYIEQERKNFDRTDYADREFVKTLASSAVNNNVLQFLNIDDFEVGDVIVQEQALTIYEFNAILQKLDIDPGVADTDYYSTLAISAGANLRNALVALATKLDADAGLNFTDYRDRITAGAGPYSLNISSISVGNPTTITTAADHYLYSIASGGRFINIVDTDTNATTVGAFEITRVSATEFTIPVNVLSVTDGVGTFTRLEQTFDDIKVCYNILMTRLNADTGATFNNYALNDTTTSQEVVITAVNVITKRVTVNAALDFVVGPLTLYKKIVTSFAYSPITMGDPVSFKQIREATIMFENKAFSSAILSFATDLLPAFIDVPFTSDGNGIFGMSGFFGQGFFGGASNSAPFRTYLPGPCQRCRYVIPKFTHRVAREQWSILGLSFTGEFDLSSRAYK